MTNWDIVTKLAFPLIVALLVAAIGRRLEYKPKLVTYMAHAAGFSMPPIAGPAKPSVPPGDKSLQTAPAAIPTTVVLAPGVQVHVHSIVVRNTGKKTAFNVRLGHNMPVHNYVLEPQVQHEKKESSTGPWEIVLPALVPNEQVLVSYLYFPPLTWPQINAYTKSDEGSARFLNVLPSPQPPRWAVRTHLAFFYFGIASAVYALISIIQWYIAVSHLLQH
ncbi:hypothetical protein [Burkholderia cepacia]|uniref:hypothetical protein n=1 Tax=Burkholderia cepacia TaxID=292 RepID=UPI001CF3C34A|nr:hypothetical protein [Burkholderia cepacia]MCA8322015.1 hypothetical protein [Burkholderia cepacia]